MTATSQGDCPRCARLPELPQAGWTLYVWPPLGHTRAKLLRYLADARVPYAEGADERALVVTVDDLAAAGGVATLTGALSPEEQADARVLPMPAARAPGLSDYPRVLSLFRLRRRMEGAPLANVLADGGIGVVFEPVAAADDPGDVIAHRARLTFPDLSVEQTAEVFELAEDAGLLFQLDRACRVACIRAARARGLDTPLFAAFHPSSIYDPEYCLRTTVAEVERTGLDPEDVIFTLIPSGHGRDVPHLQNILSYYRQRDFRVALGEIGGGHGVLDLVKDLRPDYVWLSRDVTENVTADPFRAVIARKLLEMAHRLGIGTVAVGGLPAADREWLYEHGITAISQPERASEVVVPEGLDAAAGADERL